MSAPFRAGDLDALDDAELRGIAYGRADSDTARMRAEAAARILASRGAPAAPATGQHAPPTTPWEQPGAQPAQRDRDDAEPEAPTTNDASQHRRWSTPVVAGVAVAALVLGLVGGALADRAFSTLGGDDPLTVFDREPTSRELEHAVALLGPEASADARHIGSVGLTEVYAVRIEGAGIYGGESLGTQVCMTGQAPGVYFPPEVCNPEEVVRVHGMQGVLRGIDQASVSFEVVQVIRFEWGPRGGLTASDATELVLGDDAGRFSDDDIADGLDIAAVRALERLPRFSGSDERLGRALIGPAVVGQRDSILFIGTVEPAAGDGRQVCVYSLVGGSSRASVCASLGQFRREGLRGSYALPDGQAFITYAPSGEFTVDGG